MLASLPQLVDAGQGLADVDQNLAESSTNIARSLPNVGQLRPTSGNNWPSLVQSCQMPNVGLDQMWNPERMPRARSPIVCALSACSRCGPGEHARIACLECVPRVRARNCPNLARIRPMSNNICPIGQNRPGIGRSWPEVGTGPKSVKLCPNSSKFGLIALSVSRVRPHSGPCLCALLGLGSRNTVCSSPIFLPMCNSIRMLAQEHRQILEPALSKKKRVDCRPPWPQR